MKLPLNWRQKLFTVAGLVLFFFGLWQMDIITIRQTWDVQGWSEGPYEMGRIGSFRIGMTNGTGYDLTQAFMVIGLIIAVLALWFWDT